MTVAREVIIDLLPLYTAGELSPQSKQLVEDALEGDAALRKLADALSKADPFDGLTSQPVSPAAELEKRSFSQARFLMRLRSVLMGAAIFASLSIFAFWFDGNSVTWLMQAFPRVVSNLLLGAVLLWILAFFVEFLWGLLSDAFRSLFRNK